MNEIENDMTPTENDQILESLRPRMHAARVAHFRRLAAGVAVIPLLGFGAAAMAAGGDSAGTEIETADAPVEQELTDVVDEVEPAEVVIADEVEELDDPVETTSTTTTTAPDPDAPNDIDLGEFGWLQVKAGEMSYELASADLADGWEIINTEVVDGSLVLLLSNGDVMKVVTIQPGPRDEILVGIEEFVAPTTTTTTAKPAPDPEPKDPEPKDEVSDEPKEEPKNEPAPEPIVDRFTVEVPGKGSFVVEREGETLYVGNVTANEGYTAEVHSEQGWKVYVGFSNGETIFFGKALINDAGQVEQHLWEEHIGPQPTYEWVEVPGVGAAKFEILDGQIRVYKTETAEGFESWDHNQGAYAATAKVDFEGEGQVWFIEASLTESGELVSNIYQG